MEVRFLFRRLLLEIGGTDAAYSRSLAERIGFITVAWVAADVSVLW